MQADVRTPQIQPPDNDKRWRLVTTTMRRHGYESDSLIEVLHTTQSAFGFLTDDALRFVSVSLRLPLSKVYGVATFYNLFTLQPQGEHSCVICLGTACYIKGSPSILAKIEQVTHVKPGETTPDKKVSLLMARCLGTCGLAPCGVFDGEVVGNLSPSEATQRLEKWGENVE
ncbi:MAG TPA: bidirectional hydrogenase complex protein HoxE [Aggregatilineales bacterium]|nr:bidirectional hydrogenase complex protein HoxE [Aggregatilineales bacterium]